ncbi:hypothetical protein OG782_35000 [Streptomyces sp. NBC_00876]|uniref:hypothetical protein n=1 Tax=Streptomyces sp. NBC_00876 TaxID=2975853 RepID=UPI003864CB2B|nr:hypothetical protein OG782_35000 [Streptomyces sp. NBC_00876]
MSLDAAPPTLFRASAIAAEGLPRLADGFHLRVKANPWIGFPVHPFAAWRLGFDEELNELPVQWRDAYGNGLTVPFDLEQAGGFAEGSLFGFSAADPYIWAEIDVEDRGLRVDLLDALQGPAGSARVLATRRRAPFRFGHTAIARLQVTGAGTVTAAWGLRQSSVLSERAISDRPPDLVFGLPVPLGPWYAPDANTDPLSAAADRVALGAPRRLNPPDNPDGLLPDDTDPDEETRRIMERIAPEYVDPWLRGGWGDPDVAPARATFTDSVTSEDGHPVKATAAITPSLLTMAVDPQIARYLGLATTVPFGATAPVQRADVWVVAGRWAVQRERVLHEPGDTPGAPLTLGDVLGPPAGTGWLDGQLDYVFPDAPQLIGELPGRPGGEAGPWSAATLLAVAVAAGDAPPDPPDPFRLSAAEPGGWNPAAGPDDPGPESWRQPVSLGGQPARGMVGFARTGPDGPVALHRFAPQPGQGYVTRALPLVPNWAGNNRRVVEDRTVPAGPAGASWRVWGADEFGQWSDGADLDVPLPMRPAPPPPVPEATFRAGPADGSTGPRVPGSILLRYTVPRPGSTAPGSLPVAELRVEADGVPLPPRPVVPGETVVLEATPRPFDVGEQRSIRIVSTYVDGDGTASPASEDDCAAYDARAPQAVPTSPMILWTGPKDSTGLAELALRWPPQPHAARYRIYLGDARRLAGELGLSLPPTPVRASQAHPVHAAGNRLTAKRAFTFLGETGGAPSGDGLVHFATRIPGGLRSVQFVRVVPLTAGGAEADFRDCGLVPIAVPGQDRPPPPLLDAVTDPALGLTLTLRAHGLRPELLGAAPGGAPEYRLRRTGRGVDGRYAPVHLTGVLSGPDADGVWTATVNVPAVELAPFVHRVWYADVRYPAEPALPPGVVELPADGGIEPVWSVVGSASESLWSEPSLAVESLLVPPDGPGAPAVPDVTTGADGSVALSLGGLPTVVAAADAPYLLEIYRGTAGTAAEQQAVVPVLGPALSWTDPSPVPDAHFDLVVVDPVGRRSPATRAPGAVV